MKRSLYLLFLDPHVPPFRADGHVPVLPHRARLSPEEHQDKGGESAARIGDPREDIPLS